MKSINYLIFTSILLTLFFSSCKDDEKDNMKIMPEQISYDKETSFRRFSEILSKATYNNKQVREFLKSQALEKIDNGYNIFVPLIKDLKINNSETFRDVLVSYSIDEHELSAIEKSLPLLNIHIPDVIGLNAVDLDLEDEEIPVLYQNYLYLNGEIVDSIGINQMPAFSLFVLCESGSIRQKSLLKTSSNSELSINNEYEYIDLAFSPLNHRHNRLKTSGTEPLTNKYYKNGSIPSKDIDPELITAFKNSKGNLAATRAMVYYKMSNPNETPSNKRYDIRDCIFRFKVSQHAYERMQGIATDNGSYPFYNSSTSNKKKSLTREEVLNRLLTGRNFCFLFRIESVSSDGSVISEEMKIYASPASLFNLYINESRRHSTAFRHSKYTYTINTSMIEEKWYYPMDNDHDSRFNDWDISISPIEKRISVFLIDPNNGNTKEITERYSVSTITNNEVGANITGKIKDIVNIGVNGKINNSTTTTKEVTTKYTINYKNEKLDEFMLNFFNDYPIQNITDDGASVIPYKNGKGIVEVSIMPITHAFHSYGRYYNN